MNASEICSSDISELSLLIKNREISPVEVTEAFLERIDQIDPELHSYITVAREDALKDARQAERLISEGRYIGPLHGIPFSVKDIIWTKGLRTTYGSKILYDFIPGEDATVVSRLRNAGAILLGKNNLHEFACGATNFNPHYGTCKNPWDKTKIPGGSSGGSAASVAASLCLASIGGDTGGSVRIPASLCGVVGFKQTYGLVSRYGAMTESWSLDHLSPIAKSVRDVAIISKAISGRDLKDSSTMGIEESDHFEISSSSDVSGKRIARILEYSNYENLNPEVKRAFYDSCDVLEKEGAMINDISMPWIMDVKAPAIVIAAADAVSNLWQVVKNHLSELTPDVRIFLEFGKTIQAEDYLRAQKIRTAIIEKMRAVLRDYDLIVSPATPAFASSIDNPTEGARESLIEYTILFNLLGAPAICLPCGFSSSGLPIGLQIAGKPFDDSSVLNAAYLYENRTKLDKKRPNI